MKRIYFIGGSIDEYEATASAKTGIDCKTNDGWTVFIPWTAIKKIETYTKIEEQVP